jgi:HK97 family phage major capsid protein
MKHLENLEGKDRQIAEAIIKQVAESNISKEQVEQWLDEKLIKLETLKGVEESLKAQGLELKAMKELQAAASAKKNPTIKRKLADFLYQQVTTEGKLKSADDMNRMIKNGFTFDAKALPISMANQIGAGSYIPTPTLESMMWDEAKDNVPFIRNFANVANTNAALLYWVEKYNEIGNAAFIAENQAKPTREFSLRTVSTEAAKIATFSTYTMEIMQDVENFVNQLQSDLIADLLLQEEQGLLFGTGVAPQITGIATVAPAYSLTTITTTTPNNYDAIFAAYTQILTENFVPNVAFVNPVDAANMNLSKATDGHYIMPPFSSQLGMNINGITVHAKNQIPVGSLLIGDFTKAHIRDYSPLSLEFGYINEDFKYNRFSVRAERRLHCFVKNNEQPAFVYDTFANIKALLAGSGT